MKIGEVLSELRDQDINIERHHIYYLEEKGIIKPQKIEKQKIERNEYSKADVRKIRRIWQLYKHVSSLDIATKLVDASPLDVFAFEDQIVGKELANLLQERLEEHGAINAPKVGKAEEINQFDKKKIQQMVGNLYFRLEPEPLYLLAQMVLREMVNKQIDAIVTLDEATSAVAGAMGMITLETDENFPEIIPIRGWLESKNQKTDIKVAVLKGMTGDADKLKGTICKLEATGCQIVQIILLLDRRDFIDTDSYLQEDYYEFFHKRHETTSIFTVDKLLHREGLGQLFLKRGFT